MKKWITGLPDLGASVVLILAVIIMGCLNWMAWTESWNASYGLPIPELVSADKDSLLMNLIMTTFFGAVIYGIAELVLKKNKELRLHVLMGSGIFLFVLISIVWIVQHGTVLVSDQLYVYRAAVSLALEEGSFLKDSYFWYYPHQYGMVVLFSILISAFGKSLLVIQIANIFSAGCFIVYGTKLVQLIFKKEQISLIFLLLSLSCWPLLFYSPFVYGDIISVGMIMVMIFNGIRYFQTGKKHCLVIMILASVIAFMARKNTLIGLIAMILIFTVFAFSGKKRCRSLLIVSVTCMVLVTVPAGIKYYVESKIRHSVSKGVPATAFVVMGLTDSDLGPGWYNSYVVQIPSECGFDHQKIRQRAHQDWLRVVKKVKPEFFFRKIASEWTDPSFQSLSMNNYFSEKQSGLPYQLYHNEKVYDKVLDIMNIQQSLVYFFSLAGIAGLLLDNRKKDKLICCIPLIVFIGGFLFHLAWEAKGRYCLPYYLMLIPYASFGLNYCMKKISSFLNCSQD